MNKVLFQKKRKLLLLHGPAIEASRKKLQELRKRFNQDSVVVYGKNEDAGVVLANLQTVSIFDEERLAIVENPSDSFGPLFLDHSFQTDIILWFDHVVDTKKWPGFEYLFFPERKEVTVFRFLDYLAAQDVRAFLEIEKLKTVTPPVGRQSLDVHYFITMVFYLLRNLIATPDRVPNFVKQKLAKQRNNFSQERLINLYRDILEIDFKLKSGFMEKDQAEFLLINRFLYDK
ncbi:hypothetical protein KKE78_03500 [Patescibacteria group bacterium]|nr:hypothetical protein [Patescibacteria group bacterium]